MTEFVESFSGLTYTPNDVQENGTLVLRSSNVSNGEVVDADNVYVNPQVVNSENVKVGDIVVVVRNGSRSLIGKHAQIKAFMPNTVIGAFMTGIRSECPEFTNALLNTSRFEEEIAMNMGATINQITGYMFSKMEFKVPCLDEQKKIGEYFEKLDRLITLHQRQPFLHSPPDISLIVQLTPPFYTFSWEQRKLASLCEKFTDGDWIESKDQSDFGVRLVQTGNVGVAEYLDKTNNKKWISEDTFDRLHCEEVLPGDILISRLPEPAGRACIVPLLGTKMITAVDCTIVRTAPDMSNKFLVQYLSSQAYFDDVNTCLAGGTRQRISRGNLANFNVPIPVKKSEQDAIGMFFGYLDNLITLHQRQTIVYAVIRSIRKVILAERQYFAPPMVRKSP